MRVEHEYERGGALQYLAAWDVRRGLVMGRCEPATGIEPFGRLVAQVMEQKPYRRAKRVFWIVDNGSSHRGDAAVRRLAQAYANLHSGAHARPCQLAQSSGNLLLHRATQGAHAQRLRQSRRSRTATTALRSPLEQPAPPL